jgi:pimeloyl-ACP methyl ester carboxylesterase
VSLHEEESNHVVNLKRVFGVPPRYGESGLQALSTLPMLREVDYLVVCPFGRGTMGYQGIAEQDVYDVLADVKSRYSVDEDRVYLTGSSMGGGGALWLALTRPDVWAAVAPVCADVFPGTADLAPNALNLPVRLFHGDSDPFVRVDPRANGSGGCSRWIARWSISNFGRTPQWQDFAYKNGSIFSGSRTGATPIRTTSAW